MDGASWHFRGRFRLQSSQVLGRVNGTSLADMLSLTSELLEVMCLSPGPVRSSF